MRRDLGRYSLEYNDGAWHPYPSPPTPDNTCDTLTECRARFAEWVGERPAPTAQGGQWVTVYRTAGWDGIGYAGGAIMQLVVGPRGGIRIETA